MKHKVFPMTSASFLGQMHVFAYLTFTFKADPRRVLAAAQLVLEDTGPN